MNFVRRQVSLKKRRFQEDGFDLDLSYITERIIAMGFPASGMEGLYRNPMSQVRRFLELKHKDHYKVYNLCIEREYDVSKFASRVGRFGFGDHQAPPLEMIPEFCDNVDKWLAADPSNVAAIHCKAGKGRAGMMICCYLVHSGICPTAKDAMDFFAEKRTHNRHGVTIPSQRRYVTYYESVFKHGFPKLPKIKLVSITVATSKYAKPDASAPYCKIFAAEKELFTAVPSKSNKGENAVIDCKNLSFEGDIRVVIFDRTLTKGKEKEIAHYYINSSFIENNKLILTKFEIDKISGDKKHKKFKPDFQIEMQFEDSETSVFTKIQQNEDVPKMIIEPVEGRDAEYDPKNRSPSFLLDIETPADGKEEQPDMGKEVLSDEDSDDEDSSPKTETDYNGQTQEN